MKNIGSADRVIRVILGAALVLAGVLLHVSSGQFWWLALVGAVLLLTAAVSVCPLYLPFGIRTTGKKA